jgi:hypothetical protein
MKRACVASQNWQWREARCRQYVDIGKPSDKASGDCGRNPLRAGAILAFDHIQGAVSRISTVARAREVAAKIVTAQRVFHRAGGYL